MDNGHRWCEQIGKGVVSRPGARRRIIVLTAAILIGAVGLSLVLLSPLALRELSRIHGLDWVRLSNIGQAYGAAAALLTALALGGVAAALFVQIKEARTTEEQAARQFHLELLRMGIDNVDLRRAVGFDHNFYGARQHLYINLWMTYWRSMYRLGNMSEEELRLGLAGEIFPNSVGRRMWRLGRAFYLASGTDRRTRRFYQIVEEEYQKVSQLGETVPAQDDAPAPPRHTRTTGERCIAALLTAGASVFLCRIIAKRFLAPQRGSHLRALQRGAQNSRSARLGRRQP